MNAIDTHPQRQQIIEQILSGVPLRTIAQQAVPPLHHTTVARFKLKIISPAVKSMRGATPKHQEIRDIARASGVFGNASEGAAQVQDAIRQRVHSSIDELEERFKSWIQDAERRPVIDADGMPVRDSDGTVVRQLEHKALAAHSRNALSSLEFRAKLAGLLQDGTATTVNVAVLMPEGGATIEEPGVTLDIEAAARE